jgi:hypothetical protein
MGLFAPRFAGMGGLLGENLGLRNRRSAKLQDFLTVYRAGIHRVNLTGIHLYFAVVTWELRGASVR